jgi:hypothetical protein
MKYIVIHREQVTLDLQKEIFDDLNKARQRQYELRHAYHDTIVLSEQDLLELKLHVNVPTNKAVQV